MTERAPVVVIGIGNSMRGDDGVGAAAVARLDSIEGVELRILDGEPTHLIDTWNDRRRAIVVDAVRTGAPPGTVHRIDLEDQELPVDRSGASSHLGGLAEAVALGRALERVPDEIVVVGVEPSTVELGPLSPEATEALDRLVAAVRAEVTDSDPRPEER